MLIRIETTFSRVVYVLTTQCSRTQVMHDWFGAEIALTELIGAVKILPKIRGTADHTPYRIKTIQDLAAAFLSERQKKEGHNTSAPHVPEDNQSAKKRPRYESNRTMVCLLWNSENKSELCIRNSFMLS
jgi:hypothetical protein